MRDAFAQAFYEEALTNPKLFLVVADISPASRISNFKQDFPSRFIDVGVSEQTLIGLSAGLALRGYKPFAYTIANFAIYRPFEQIRDDVAIRICRSLWSVWARASPIRRLARHTTPRKTSPS
jgi:transketolase